ncbi:MAG TPA: hypothetical protein VJ851_00740 [Jatrophihabitans sp.]|nr:hypothetical protein [Jatrophihabitans sp.]
MGWAVGYDDNWQRDIGYGVPATCDQPDCSEAIDRGLGYVCGGEPYGGETGCGLYFCSEHGGGMRDCHHVFKDDPEYKPSPDTSEWIDWKLTDESWAAWRAEHPELVELMETARAG